MTHSETVHRVVGGGRRKLDASDIDFAKERRRLGWGWQAIANMRGVNVTDLRMACGDLKPEPLPRAVVRAAKVRLNQKDRLLRAISDGFATRASAAERAGIANTTTSVYLSQLKADGMVVNDGHNRNTWVLTPSGAARLAQVEGRA